MLVAQRNLSGRALWVLALCLVGGACAPQYYVPNTHNVPLLTHEREIVGSFSTGSSRAELQGAYALTDRLGLIASASFFEEPDDSTGDGGRGGIAEIGIGYQRPLSSRTSLQLFGLLGGGDLENHFPSTLQANPGTTGVIEGALVRYGVQPALGFRGRHVHAILSTRVVGLRYSEVDGSLVFGGDDQVQYLRARDTHFLVEPAVTLRVGSETVKGQIQLGRSFNLSHEDFRQAEGHLTFGITWMPSRDVPRRLR